MSRTRDVTRSASELRIVLGQLVRRLRAEHRFPISQGMVLARLDREGPRTTSALAAAERMRPQSMAQTVGELQAAGLVARRPDPIDRRQILIELTDEGRDMLLADRRRRDGWLARAIASELTDDEQETLIRAVPLLRRLTQLEGHE
ncbi:MAG TPA: MarR family transcriptional regulator [Gaiellaceae bacterium]|nr:MarR family transcriptional regulator [Gaiellaceae bacterium]